MLRGIVAGAALVALAALPLACGDDNEGLPTGDISKAEYIEQAGEICAAADREISDAADEFLTEANLRAGEEPSPELVSEFVEESVIPSVREQLEDLRELEAPAEDVERIEAIYDTAENELDQLVDDPSAFADPQAKPFKEANRLALDYGLAACAG